MARRKIFVSLIRKDDIQTFIGWGYKKFLWERFLHYANFSVVGRNFTQNSAKIILKNWSGLNRWKKNIKGWILRPKITHIFIAGLCQKIYWRAHLKLNFMRLHFFCTTDNLRIKNSANLIFIYFRLKFVIKKFEIIWRYSW